MSPTPDEIRIREALERIQTPAYDIAGAVREQRARRGRRMPLRSPRRLVSAVLAAALLTVTAAAVFQVSVGWKTIFGQDVVIPDELAIPLQKGATMNGCTLTVEDAIVTRTGVALIYSFRYAAGSPLSNPIHFETVSLLTDGTDTAYSSRGQSIFTDPRDAVQYFYQEFSLAEDPGDRDLTLTIGPASSMETSEVLTASLDLAAVYQAHPIAFPTDQQDAYRTSAYLEQDTSSVPLPQAWESSEVQFAGVGFMGDELCLALITPPYDLYQGVSCDIVSLLDTRTGKIIDNTGSGTYPLEGEDSEIREARFQGLTVDDLPYLQPQIIYTRSVPLTQKPWEVSFRAKSAQTYSRALSLDLSDGSHIDHLFLSPLGIRIEGTRPASLDEDGVLDRAPHIAVILQDNSIIGASVSECGLSMEESSARETFEVTYVYQAGTDSRRFLSVSDVTGIRIGDTTISIAE